MNAVFNARYTNQVLTLTFHGRVGVEEMVSCVLKLESLAGSAAKGFSLLIDLSGLDFMDRTCAPHLGRVLEICGQHGVARIVAVVPDPMKDIGLRLLSFFHSHRAVRINLVESLPEAIASLPTRATL